MLTEQDIINEFKKSGAMLSGHFILSSGLHSANYLQCARVMMNAARGERLCKSLSDKINEWLCKKNENAVKTIKFDYVVAPAMGGVVVGYEIGRQLNIPAMFCERVEGKFELRRGFSLEKNARVLIVEDVVTTGKSSMEAVACVEENGGHAIAIASLIDRRSSNDKSLSLPLISLLKLDFPTYSSDNIPPELAAIPAEKPGSRFLKGKTS